MHLAVEGLYFPGARRFLGLFLGTFHGDLVVGKQHHCIRGRGGDLEFCHVHVE